MKYVVLSILVAGCGSDPSPIIESQTPLLFWPPIGNSEKAVNYLNDEICFFGAFGFPQDIVVLYDARSCGTGGGEPGRISIMAPSCPQYEYASNLGLTIHEIGHALGCNHSTSPRDVMNGLIPNDWILGGCVVKAVSSICMPWQI